jgi:hypothetical protein
VGPKRGKEQERGKIEGGKQTQEQDRKNKTRETTEGGEAGSEGGKVGGTHTRQRPEGKSGA